MAYRSASPGLRCPLIALAACPFASFKLPSQRRPLYRSSHRFRTYYTVYSIFKVQARENPPLITLTKKAKNGPPNLKIYQICLAKFFKLFWMLLRTRRGATPSAAAISCTVIPK